MDSMNVEIFFKNSDNINPELIDTFINYFKPVYDNQLRLHTSKFYSSIRMITSYSDHRKIKQIIITSDEHLKNILVNHQLFNIIEDTYEQHNIYRNS